MTCECINVSLVLRSAVRATVAGKLRFVWARLSLMARQCPWNLTLYNPMPASDYTRPGNGMIIVAPNRCSETENADVIFFE